MLKHARFRPVGGVGGQRRVPGQRAGVVLGAVEVGGVEDCGLEARVGGVLGRVGRDRVRGRDGDDVGEGGREGEEGEKCGREGGWSEAHSGGVYGGYMVGIELVRAGRRCGGSKGWAPLRSIEP